MQDKISVLVPFHSLEKYLFCCLQSIQKQTYKNFEVVMLANNVHDDSKKIAEKFAKTDSRFLLFDCPKKTKNIAVIRQCALQLASGKFVAWVDGDDAVLPTFLEQLHKAITQNNAQLSVCGVKAQRGKKLCNQKVAKEKVCKIFLPQQVQKMCMVNSNINGAITNKMFVTKIAKQISFDPQCKIFEDLDYCLRYLNLCQRVAVQPAKNYVYVHRSGSLTKHTKPINLYLRINTLNKIVAKFSGTQIEQIAKFDRGMQTVVVMHYACKKKYACDGLKNKIFAKYLTDALHTKTKGFGISKFAKLAMRPYLIKAKMRAKK